MRQAWVGAAVAVCASGSVALGQALVAVSPTMQQGGGYDYFLGGNPVALGTSLAQAQHPVPGAFGPVVDTFSFGGATWSTTTTSAWSISSTATTTGVTGQVVMFALADATQATASASNHSFAQISFVFTAAQPISYNAIWSSPTAGPSFGTGSYLVLGPFSPYPQVNMPSLTTMSNSGTLPAGTHVVTLVADLTVTAQAGGFVNDAIGLSFDLQATVIPAPGALALLGLGAVGAGRRRR
ncbi:MAG: PEP-CTERM sorting domain-containing protein [Phycisphaeraceae bacterium]|nr:PEP-CTERM sorting domain-containing protein [Phycisphaeraceae bacterium]